MIPLKHHVNKLTLKIRKSNICKSHTSCGDETKILYPLKNRGLVKVSGQHAAHFLQGLITNDMKHLETGEQSIYTMFLSNKGKVLYDTLVHKWGNINDNFMIDCDKSIQKLLTLHLKLSNLSNNIVIKDESKRFNVWALITPPDYNADFGEPDIRHNIHTYKDPRLADLGYRVITTTHLSHVDIRHAVGKDIVIKSNDLEYLALRYRLGVSEGAADLFPDTCFPLEANCDYLRGISFQKGFYIGHEIVNIHQADVRKRIMPIHFMDSKIDNPQELQTDANILANKQCGRANVGIFKNRVGCFGIGLLKVKEALEAKTLHIGSNQIEIIQPHWWPKKTPKKEIILSGPIKDK